MNRVASLLKIHFMGWGEGIAPPSNLMNKSIATPIILSRITNKLNTIKNVSLRLKEKRKKRFNVSKIITRKDFFFSLL